MSDAQLTPREQLMLSRARILDALQAHRMSGVSSEAHPMAGGDAAWLAQFKAIPGAEIALDLLKRWWAQNPLHAAETVGADAIRAVFFPLAQKNPLGLVLGAAFVGGLVAVVRPWRWIPASVVLAGLLPPLISDLFSTWLKPTSVKET
jgi:hypothetical protein